MYIWFRYDVNYVTYRYVRDYVMKTKQVSFKFDGTQVEALENIKTKLHASSQAEAIRKSLNLTSALATAHERGFKIVIESPDGETSQEIMIL